MVGRYKKTGFPWRKIISLCKLVSDLCPIDILTGEIAVEVTGVVGGSPTLWYFSYIASTFLTTQADSVNASSYSCPSVKHVRIIEISYFYVSVWLSIFKFLWGSIMHGLGEIWTLKRNLMGFFFQKHLMFCNLWSTFFGPQNARFQELPGDKAPLDFLGGVYSII